MMKLDISQHHKTFEKYAKIWDTKEIIELSVKRILWWINTKRTQKEILKRNTTKYQIIFYFIIF